MHQSRTDLNYLPFEGGKDNEPITHWLAKLFKGWCLTKGLTLVSTANWLGIQQSQHLLQAQ